MNLDSKKNRKRIPKENKIRAELQKEINSSCPFCNNNDVGHFQIHHIDENPSNNDKLNLILLCPNCHSKITKGDYSPMEVLQKKIQFLPSPGSDSFNSVNIADNKNINNSIIGNNNTVTINRVKKIQKYPEGCIGYDNIKANYISHLINRFHEYKEKEIGKERMNYAIFPSQIKKKYKLGANRSLYNIPIEKFDELVSFIHSRIDGTMFGKKQGGLAKNYSTFAQYTLRGD